MKLPINMNFRKKLKADRFWIIGDIHGMYNKLQELYFQISTAQNSRPQNEKYTIVCVGDLTDRGDQSLDVLKFFLMHPEIHVVMGNHDNKLWRYLSNNMVTINNGLEKTVAELDEFSTKEEQQKFHTYLSNLPLTIELEIDYPDHPPHFSAVVVHAAFHPEFYGYGKWSQKRTMEYAIFGPTNGMLANGFPDRIEWENDYKGNPITGSPFIFYGHRTMGLTPKLTPFTCGLDTGCYETGVLTAVSYPDLEVLQTK